MFNLNGGIPANQTLSTFILKKPDPDPRGIPSNAKTATEKLKVAYDEAVRSQRRCQ